MLIYSDTPNVVLIGAGIMSATLGAVLKELEPSLSIAMFETLKDCAQESSQAWNNAGTGHAANCELNYTPLRPDGGVDISKALSVNTEFDLSRQLWAYFVRKGAIPDPRAFLHPCPHMSFVWGRENVAFLRTRFKEMSAHHCFAGMEYSEDRVKIAEWAPLIVEGRDEAQPIAATRIITGTDVDYGALTHLLIAALSNEPGFDLRYNRQVVALDRESGGRWRVTIEDTYDGTRESVSAGFVFIGAGGASIELLQKSGIPEGRGYGGFPVSGIWLRCDDNGVTKRHHAKVYGKAASGSPPMSVPHLDTRVIGDHTSLLFGPYAGFSSRFLKHGSLTDLLRVDNAGEHRSTSRRGARQYEADRISDRPGASKRDPPIRYAEAVLPAGDPKRMEGSRRRTARPNYQARQGRGRLSGIRHRTRIGGGQVACGVARGLARGVDGRIHHDRSSKDLLRGQVDRRWLAAGAQASNPHLWYRPRS